jgi:hypothetical protein
VTAFVGPERTPVESRLLVNSIELALFDRPGECAPILFVHATGFHARCWDQVILGVPGRRCIAVDLRGHGRSSKEPPHDWDALGRDIAALPAPSSARKQAGFVTLPLRASRRFPSHTRVLTGRQRSGTPRQSSIGCETAGSIHQAHLQPN